MDIDGLIPWDGKEESLPEHIRALGKAIIPPAWTDVLIAPDPKADLYVLGRDSKGRAQYRYSPEHVRRANERKFQRVRAYLSEFTKVHEYIRSLEHPDVRDCLELIYVTGLRPGSQRETAADKDARGATTLRGENVLVDGDRVRLEFVGKDGVFQSHRIGVHFLRDNLADRASAAGEDGLLYPDASDRSLRRALEPLGLHPKDLRTLLACRMARKLLAGRPPASSATEYARIRNQVGDAVAKRLGNTRSIALSSYIDPAIFAAWDPDGTRAWERKHKKAATMTETTKADGAAVKNGRSAYAGTQAHADHEQTMYDAHHGYFDDIDGHANE